VQQGQVRSPSRGCAQTGVIEPQRAPQAGRGELKRKHQVVPAEAKS
jgi:hypothetical protein